MAIIGFQSRTKVPWWRDLSTASLFALCLIGIFGVLLPVFFRVGVPEMKNSLILALAPFIILLLFSLPTLGFLLIPVWWALYLSLMTVSLRRVRKAASREMRVLGRLAVIMVFGAAYAAVWYLTIWTLEGLAVSML